MIDPATAIDRLLTRRRLVQAGGAVTATLYVGGLTGTARAAGVPSYLTRSAYASLTGTPFAAVADTGLTTTLRLLEVSDLARARHEPGFAGRDDAFALLFGGPRDGVLGSGIHELRSPALGVFSVFISPVQGGGAGEQRYEVVVDRSVRLASALQDAPEPMQRANDAAAGRPAAAAALPEAQRAHPSGPTHATAEAKAKKKPAKLVRSALLARRGGVLTVDVRVASGRGLVSVRATLLRDGIEHARAARRLKGRVGVRLDLRQVQRTPPGSYMLRMTVTDRHGTRTSSLRRVTVPS